MLRTRPPTACSSLAHDRRPKKATSRKPRDSTAVASPLTACKVRHALKVTLPCVSTRHVFPAPTRRFLSPPAGAPAERSRPHAQGAAAAARFALAPGQPLAQSSVEVRAAPRGAACASRAAEGRTHSSAGSASWAQHICGRWRRHATRAKAATIGLTTASSSPPATRAAASTTTDPAPGALAASEQPLRRARRPA